MSPRILVVDDEPSIALSLEYLMKRAGYQVYGLPNYVVWHVDTDEKPGNA